MINDESVNDDLKIYILFKLYTFYDSDDLESFIKSNVDKKVLDKIKGAKLLSTISKTMNDKSKKNREILSTALKSYDSILNKTVELSREFNFDNSLDISNLYSYLLWEGYYSKDRINTYSMTGRNVIFGAFSFDIFSGLGVCLNYSDMHTDLLNKCGYPSCLIINKVDGKNFKKFYIPNISQNKNDTKLMDIGGVFLSPLINKIGNHAFTLVYENGKFYIYDVTNSTIFKLDGKYDAENIVGTGHSDLNPMMSFALNFDKERIDTLDKFMVMDETDDLYKRSDFVTRFENNVEMFKDNERLFEEFREDIKDDVVRIDNEVKKFKLKKRGQLCIY